MGTSCSSESLLSFDGGGSCSSDEQRVAGVMVISTPLFFHRMTVKAHQDLAGRTTPYRHQSERERRIESCASAACRSFVVSDGVLVRSVLPPRSKQSTPIIYHSFGAASRSTARAPASEPSTQGKSRLVLLVEILLSFLLELLTVKCSGCFTTSTQKEFGRFGSAC